MGEKEREWKGGREWGRGGHQTGEESKESKFEHFSQFMSRASQPNKLIPPRMRGFYSVCM